jgi:transposase
MATKAVKTKQLNIEQENAIDLLIQGKSDREVAEAVGVGRPTVWEWRNQRSEFIAELEHRRRDLWGTQVDRLRQLVSKAVDVLAEDIQLKDDLKLRQAAAVHILRSVGLYGANLKPEYKSELDITLDLALKGL